MTINLTTLTAEQVLTQAADALRRAVPLINYAPRVEGTRDIKHIRYAGDWSGYNCVASRLKRVPRELFTLKSWRRSYWRELWPQEKFAWYRRLLGNVIMRVALCRVYLRTPRHLPDSVIDEGNVIVHWSECTPFIQLWTPEVARHLADWLDDEAARSRLSLDNVQVNPAALRLAEDVLTFWHGGAE
jgi:hypothetical protein